MREKDNGAAEEGLRWLCILHMFNHLYLKSKCFSFTGGKLKHRMVSYWSMFSKLGGDKPLQEIVDFGKLLVGWLVS